MPLNTSGAISLAGATAGQSIALELSLGTTTQISLNDTAVRTLAGGLYGGGGAGGGITGTLLSGSSAQGIIVFTYQLRPAGTNFLTMFF